MFLITESYTHPHTHTQLSLKVSVYLRILCAPATHQRYTQPTVRRADYQKHFRMVVDSVYHFGYEPRLFPESPYGVQPGNRLVTMRDHGRP